MVFGRVQTFMLPKLSNDVSYLLVTINNPPFVFSDLNVSRPEDVEDLLFGFGDM